MPKYMLFNSENSDTMHGAGFFQSLHKDYKRGKKSKRQIAAQLIAELEEVWHDDSKLACLTIFLAPL